MTEHTQGGEVCAIWTTFFHDAVMGPSNQGGSILVVLVLFMVFLAARAPLAAAIGLLVAGGQHCLREPIHGELEGREHADAFVPYVPEAVGVSFWGAGGLGSRMRAASCGDAHGNAFGANCR